MKTRIYAAPAVKGLISLEHVEVVCTCRYTLNKSSQIKCIWFTNVTMCLRTTGLHQYTKQNISIIHSFIEQTNELLPVWLEVHIFLN